MLIIFGGLPGSGKSTVAQALALRTGACYLRVDTIEQAISSSASLADRHDVGPAGYVTLYRVAEDNLRLGRTVIADSVNPIELPGPHSEKSRPKPAAASLRLKLSVRMSQHIAIVPKPDHLPLKVDQTQRGARYRN